jgi:predicted RNase H-like HicB family nuclease
METNPSAPGAGNENHMRDIKVVVERHPDTYIAYPIGLGGVVVGQGETFQEAVDSVTQAMAFHIETFGDEVLRDDDPVLEAFITETQIAV